MNVKEIKIEISKLSSFDILDVLHDCVGLLVPVSPLEMSEFSGVSKKTVLNRIKAKKHLYFEFDNRKYPIINYHLKSKN